MRAKIFFLLTLIILSVLAYNVFKKEIMLARGQTFYLELAPVDPRSLLQGDYMQLNYKISNRDLLFEQYDHVCLILNDKKVAEYLMDLEHDECEKSGGVCISVHYDRGGYHVAPTSFFFQEGYAQLYETARYAILKHSGHKVLLKGLADKDLKEICPACHST
ncbi:Uncharacterized membrane-anchored protein [Elusimicrobium minutum Pei191]|uniref:Uncharacterized membrane-anchored protein n=1 Tax=Elusimicrobium minutum (strain Pei191) TaxID=445932 RepID=B2KEA0_ELUMP|nr:GDYXXLXY domain-containing protein [Elusimicrobium minutum]ACC98846.1 Uncharacterized membrane-anchored protein [Elusimicrobium minutum Pei191]